MAENEKSLKQLMLGTSVEDSKERAIANIVAFLIVLGIIENSNQLDNNLLLEKLAHQFNTFIILGGGAVQGMIGYIRMLRGIEEPVDE